MYLTMWKSTNKRNLEQERDEVPAHSRQILMENGQMLRNVVQLPLRDTGESELSFAVITLCALAYLIYMPLDRMWGGIFIPVCLSMSWEL